MNIGDKKGFSIPPEDGFGQRDAKLVRIVPRRVFKQNNVEPRPGLVVDFGNIKGRVQSVSAGRIMVDFNNPLAGKTLKYELEVIESIGQPDAQIRALLEFYGVSKAEVRLAEGEAEIEAPALPIELKNRLLQLITEYVKVNNAPIKKVKFVEVFEK
jgi:FKBP-type peptidyl-prolyl cis-trans isomerase 2